MARALGVLFLGFLVGWLLAGFCWFFVCFGFQPFAGAALCAPWNVCCSNRNTHQEQQSLCLPCRPEISRMFSVFHTFNLWKNTSCSSGIDECCYMDVWLCFLADSQPQCVLAFERQPLLKPWKSVKPWPSSGVNVCVPDSVKYVILKVLSLIFMYLFGTQIIYSCNLNFFFLFRQNLCFNLASFSPKSSKYKKIFYYNRQYLNMPQVNIIEI